MKLAGLQSRENEVTLFLWETRLKEVRGTKHVSAVTFAVNGYAERSKFEMPCVIEQSWFVAHFARAVRSNHETFCR